jgi:hypothetical protein
MENVKSIEKAIQALPLAEFRDWFAAFDAAAWDRQLEQDAAAGKLDDLAAEASTDFRSGSAREL